MDPPVEELWGHVKDLSVEERRFLVEELRELQSRDFCKFLCDRSLEAGGNGRGAEALELAKLAVHVAEMSWEPGGWKLRLKGYAMAHLAAAHRAADDGSAAEETLQSARRVWDAGAPDEPLDLDVRRLVEIEALVCADRNQ